ncbi:MAG: hypothetical protein ACI9U0_001628 [Flavobacteriales bacterium]|jgi:hypothetical protein|tara:strand:- start:233 stop:568 length:336 start_codon:yes stop_codon:yes gene_type:complete
MKHLLKLSLALFIVLITACTKDTITEDTPDEECTTAYTYDADIATIINNNCVSCHSGTQPPRLTTYSEVFNSIDRVKARAIIEKTMPVSEPLSDSDIEKINCWINQNTPEN